MITENRFDKFTEKAKRVLSSAQEEARRSGHQGINTEHLLLGLVAEKDSAAAKILVNLGVELSRIRDAVRFIITGGGNPIPGDGSLALTSRAKKVIELMVDEARRLNDQHIGTEHLLISLLREGEGVAAGVLEGLGVSVDKARLELAKMRQELPPSSAAAEPDNGKKLKEAQEEFEAASNELIKAEGRLRAATVRLRNAVGELIKRVAQPTRQG